jgi:hypothetical protein
VQNDPVVRFTMDVRLHEWSAPGEAPTTPPADGQVPTVASLALSGWGTVAFIV